MGILYRNGSGIVIGDIVSGKEFAWQVRALFLCQVDHLFNSGSLYIKWMSLGKSCNFSKPQSLYDLHED